MRARSAAFAAALLTLIAVEPATATIPPSRTTTTTSPDHIVVMVFENREAGTIMAPSSSAPYFRALARRSVTLSRLFAITHPSLPNYLALTSGSTHGVTTDCTTCLVDGTNVVDRLEQAAISWKAYMESMPEPCSTAAIDGRYAMKHNPFMYYTDIRDDVDRCNNVVPLRRLTVDLGAGSLPTFAWVTPDLCHDMHDCSVATGDRFLHTWVPRIVPALGPDGILIIVFDEGVTSAGCCHGRAAGGHIAGIITGPGAGVGVTIRTKVNQYSVLKLIEEAWGLGDLGQTANAPVIDGWQARGA
ncbi:MAG: alkaline phosphatase family protein [Actinomycetota bacterium]